MNNKGQMGIAIVTAIMIFMVGMVVVNILKPEITTARSSASGLDCANTTFTNGSSISDGTRLTCLVIDFTIPYFIIIIFSVAGGAIVGRLAR